MRMSIDGVIGELTTLPGCSQICVSHGVFLPPSERGRGKGKTANKRRQNIVFNDLGYDVLMCTVDEANKPQINILQNNGWKKSFSFVSRKTGNSVAVYFLVYETTV